MYQHPNEKGYTHHIIVSKKNKELFLNECVIVLKRLKPHLANMNLTQNMIFTEMLNDYLREED